MTKQIMKCVYGSPCFAICINPKCKKFGPICQKGYEQREQCYLFHDKCQHIKWSQLEKFLSVNPFTQTPEFVKFRMKVQGTFIGAIQKITQQLQKFRIWIKTFGYGIEVMKLIKLMNEKNFKEITGTLLAPIISNYLRQQGNIAIPKPPLILEEELRGIQHDINDSLEHITNLYLKTGKRKTKQPHQSSMINIPSNSINEQTLNMNNLEFVEYQKISINIFPIDKIVKVVRNLKVKHYQPSTHHRILQNFLQKQPDDLNRSKDFSLEPYQVAIYYIVLQFHRRCDSIPNTLILIQTQFNKIIGGFTPLEWKSNKKQWMADKLRQSFIFSLTLMQKYDLILPQFAISCNGQKGPIFGCCDICLVDHANKQKSSAQFPISFNINKKYHRGDQASFALTGHPKGQYRTKEWEVFQLQFE